jgi:hypothetical protein
VREGGAEYTSHVCDMTAGVSRAEQSVDQLLHVADREIT